MNARTLADRSRDRLRAEGLDDEAIQKLAVRYVAEERGDDLDAFIRWAADTAGRHESGADPDEMGEQSFPASDPPSTWASSGGTSPKPEAR
jgi:hypothetical protein